MGVESLIENEKMYEELNQEEAKNKKNPFQIKDKKQCDSKRKKWRRIIDRDSQSSSEDDSSSSSSSSSTIVIDVLMKKMPKKDR